MNFYFVIFKVSTSILRGRVEVLWHKFRSAKIQVLKLFSMYESVKELVKIPDLEARSHSQRAAAAEEELSPQSPSVSDPGIGTVTCFCPSRELAAQ